MTSTTSSLEGRTFRAGAVLLGVGLGGLADGIVFHQVLQWHNLVANAIPPDSLDALRTNVFWDGVFHVATTLTLVIGFVLLQHSWRRRDVAARSGGAVLGWVLVGWGAFNITDQLLLHEVLNLHDIRVGVENPGVYNWSYGASGVLLVLLGLWVVRRWRASLVDGPADPPTVADRDIAGP